MSAKQATGLNPDAHVLERNSSEDLADAHQAMGYFTIWIQNADTKAGLLSAALAVVLGAMAQQGKVLGDVLRPNHLGEWAALVLLCCLGFTVLVATISLALVLTPRTPPPQEPSRFGFPTVASDEWKHSPATRAQAGAEAWGQAQVLALIAARKYATLRFAARSVFLGIPLFAAWVVVTSILR